MSWWATQTRPASGLRNPMMWCSDTDLPTPLRPRMHTVSSTDIEAHVIQHAVGSECLAHVAEVDIGTEIRIGCHLVSFAISPSPFASPAPPPAPPAPPREYSGCGRWRAQNPGPRVPPLRGCTLPPGGTGCQSCTCLLSAPAPRPR